MERQGRQATPESNGSSRYPLGLRTIMRLREHFSMGYTDSQLADLDASATPSELWPAPDEPQILTDQDKEDLEKMLRALDTPINWDEVQELAPEKPARTR